jgi:anti-sigma factor RsiW
MADNEDRSAVECRQIAELLTDYLDGTLPKETRELLEWHIDGCAPCVAFVNTFKGTVHAMRRLPETPPIPPELKQRLLQVIRQRESQPSRDRT